MPSDSPELGSHLRLRLLGLIAQLKRDQADLKSHQAGNVPADIIADGDRVYRRLFDALQATLHNLNSSQAVE